MVDLRGTGNTNGGMVSESVVLTVFNSVQLKALARVLLWRPSSHSAGRGTGGYCWLLVSNSQGASEEQTEAYTQSPAFASVLPAKRNNTLSVRKSL